MIAFFFLILFSGHIYVIAVVTAVQIISFKEVIAIANVPSKEKNLRFTKTLNWYFLAITMYFLYGESVIYYFKHILLVDKVFLPLATHHRFICFTLYVMGRLSCIVLTSLTGWLRFQSFRIRLLRGIVTEGGLSAAVHPICLDPYGPLFFDCTGAFCHQQYL